MIQLRLIYDGTYCPSDCRGVSIPGQTSFSGMNKEKRFKLSFPVSFSELDIDGELVIVMTRNDWLNTARRMLVAAGEPETPQPERKGQ